MPERKKQRVLHVADDDGHLLTALLTRDSHEVTEADGTSHALALTALGQFDLIVVENGSSVEATLRAGEILESIGDAFYSLDEELRFTYVNRKAEQFWGKRREDLLGRKFMDVFPHVEGSHSNLEIMWALKEGRPHTYETVSPIIGRWVEVSAYPSSSGLSVYFRDITGRKQAEAALRESEERYRTLFNSIGEGFCVVELIFDDGGRIVDWVYQATNPAFERQIGWRDAVGKRLREMMPDLEEFWLERFGRVAATGEAERIIEYSPTMDIWFDVYAFHVGQPGSRLMGLIFSNVTERKRTEEALRESEARLAVELADAKQLHQISSLLLQQDNIDALYEQILNSAIALMKSDAGSMQVLDAEKNELRLLTWKGFHPESARFWERVGLTSHSACGEALRKGERFILPDIEQCDFMAGTEDLALFRRSGLRAVQSTPLTSRDGRLVGMISTHWREPHEASEHELQLLDVVARQAADLLERTRAEESLRDALAEVRLLKDRLQEENVYLREEAKLERHFGEFVGRSDAIKHVLHKIAQVAPTDSTVLVTGETGTGKELVARAIHSESPRRERPLIKVNCAALSPTLIESELFGHEKGAFTGAVGRKVGRFELADKATLFLDEIGEIPLELQPKLLRVLQDGEFERLGSAHTIRADVRVIAATNRDLWQEVQAGRFRADLFYRLNVYPINVPPLRLRREDIPLLVEHFVSVFSKKMGKEITSVVPATLEVLRSYLWPGNVRELANEIERAVITTPGTVLQISNITETLPADAPQKLRKTLEEVEREHITAVLEATGWKIEGTDGASKILGLNPSTLRTRMTKLGIQSRKPWPPPRP